MKFPIKYKVLNLDEISDGQYKIVPVRYEDRFNIMKWRNEQMYHLRQSKPLSEDDQERYFTNVVAQLFDKEQPDQILFSYLEGDVCIGYGGLVHINWIDKNAELSFIMDTKLEAKYFEFHWQTYLGLIEKVAFTNIGLHKVFTYAFDLRPHLYKVIEDVGFELEARLKEHCLYDGIFKDVLIHSKWNTALLYRKPIMSDAQLYFDWTNDADVRKFSYHSDEISFDDHINWFEGKLNDENCFMYLFYYAPQKYVGQVRIQKSDETNAEIGVSIDKRYRGKGLASVIISKASAEFLNNQQSCIIHAYIKEENVSSAKGFEKAGYKMIGMKNIKGAISFHFIKSKE